MIITDRGLVAVVELLSHPTRVSFADFLAHRREQEHAIRGGGFDWGKVEGPGQRPDSTGVCDGCDRVVQHLSPSSDGRALFCPTCLPAAETAILEGK